jgi:hypothetical protein
VKQTKTKSKTKAMPFALKVPLLRAPAPRAGLKSANPLFRLAHWGRFQILNAPVMN